MKKKIKDSLGDLKDKVVPATDLVFAKSTKKSFDGKKLDRFINDEFGQTGSVSTQTSWIKQIEDYCGSNNLLPEDLIAFHAAGSKSAVRGKQSGKDEEIKQRPSMGNWRKDFIKAKTGYSPTD